MADYAHNPLCLTPQMTSANTPSPVVVSASSEYSSDWAGWGAFTQSATDRSWSPATSAPCWLQVDLGAGVSRVLDAYTVVGRHDSATSYNATAWIMYGSNDNATWVPLDVREAQALGAAPQMTTYTLPVQSAPYRYFRMSVTAGGGCIGELELIGGVPPPSLPMRGRPRMR